MSARRKILDLDELAGTLSALRARKKKIVQCHGVFDLLHIGHIKHFERAKELGDVLVVTVTPDEYVNKGLNRPAFSQALRMQALAALECVDYVALNKWPSAEKTIRLLRPHVYAKGPDYKNKSSDHTGKISAEKSAVKSVGGRLVLTDDPAFSSSSLINRHFAPYAPEVRDFLSRMARKYSPQDIFRYFSAMKSLRVLVVGEAIIDEYRYCEQIGKSAKEPVLAVRHVSVEHFIGGTLAIANHVASFSDRVSVLTYLGDRSTYKGFIDGRLNRGVGRIFLERRDSPTILKRRFVENYLFQKLFEVYEINDAPLDPDQNRALCRKLESLLPKYDVVIVADYGHGMLGEEAIKLLSRKSPFLALNTQANAGNRGLHTVSKYPRADFVSLARHELLLEERNYREDLRKMARRVADKLSCRGLLVTCGKDGNLAFSRKEGFFQAPAFTSTVQDRMGAGDAVLSVASLLSYQEAPLDILCLVANIAGAQAVATVGNRAPLGKPEMLKQIEAMLK